MPEVVWGVKSPAELCWHRWGEAHFVFDPASGQTHFLNELGAQSIRILADTALTAEGLYAHFLAQYSIEDDRVLLDSIRATLKQLDDLGLVSSSIG
jgi:PqqD family protein of HPr-rel-A system